MKATKPFYYLIILLLTFLLYDQSIGLNVLLISILTIGYVSDFNLKQKTKQWWAAASIWLIAGLSLFHSHTNIGGLLYIFTGFHFLSTNANSKSTFPFSFMATAFSSFLGAGNFFLFGKRIRIKQNNEEPKDKAVVKKILLYAIPTLILIIFLKLYQVANPDFETYTAFLNLNFIKWPFVLFFTLLSIIMYGLYNFRVWDPVKEMDENAENKVFKGNEDAIEKQFGIDNENKMALLLIGALNLLLIGFLIVDAQTLFFNTNNQLTHSEYVHQGVNVLITSILFVILIISYVYRGGINFIKNDTLKVITYLWLILNIILTVFNALKNYHYIQDWGMTHKRIGVYIYLLLCLIGLIYTIYKVSAKRSFWFLIRKVSFTFLSILSFYALVNWNKVIAQYNLDDERYTYEKIDFYYNASLGPEAYPLLLEYFHTHPEKTKPEHITYLGNRIFYFKQQYFEDWTAFPSLKISDWMVYHELENYTPPKPYRYSQYPYENERINH